MGNRTRKDYMQDGTFAELMEAAEQALTYERGAREGYRVVLVDGPVSPQRDPASEKVHPKSKPGFRRNHKNTSHR
jgi:hypothetical protein